MITQILDLEFSTQCIHYPVSAWRWRVCFKFVSLDGSGLSLQHCNDYPQDKSHDHIITVYGIYTPTLFIYAQCEITVHLHAIILTKLISEDAKLHCRSHALPAIPSTMTVFLETRMTENHSCAWMQPHSTTLISTNPEEGNIGLLCDPTFGPSSLPRIYT